MTTRPGGRGRAALIGAVLGAAILAGTTACVPSIPLPFFPGPKASPSAAETAVAPTDAPTPTDAQTSVASGDASVTVPPVAFPTEAVPTQPPQPTQAPKPTKAPKPTQAPKPTKPPKPAGPACPSGINVPAGVDHMVCGGAPAGASHAPGNAGGFYSFATPSKNIGCDWYENADSGSNGIECAIIQATFKEPPKPKSCDLDWNGRQVSLNTKAYKGGCRGDIMQAIYLLQTGANLPALAYGKAYAYSTLACFSDESGLTCWNVKNHHGFKLSRTVEATW